MKHKAQSTKHKAQSTKHKAQSTKHKTQNNQSVSDSGKYQTYYHMRPLSRPYVRVSLSAATPAVQALCKTQKARKIHAEDTPQLPCRSICEFFKA
jgi:hypothetical protein